MVTVEMAPASKVRLDSLSGQPGMRPACGPSGTRDSDESFLKIMLDVVSTKAQAILVILVKLFPARYFYTEHW